MKRLIHFLLLSGVLLSPLAGLSFAADGPVAIMAEKPPVIDGSLDDPVWQNALPYKDFKTFKPHFGEDVSEKTEMIMAYDRNMLYFAFRCFDRESDKIRATVTTRDNIDDQDYVGVLLDMTNTRQSAYMFCVNPRGVQQDAVITPDGNGDGSFDAVWTSQGQLTSEGYTVEMAIPLKSIRFPGGKAITVGVQGTRAIARKSEQCLSPEFKPDQGALIGQNHQVVLHNLKAEGTMELLPAMTLAQTSDRPAGSMVHGDARGDFSLTGKLGLNSNLTLDATYNPDFSQVESDAGQVDINLRSAIYYNEKRSFFLEGMDDFRFATSQEAAPLMAVVHTRSIVDPMMGVKLTGKIGSKNSLSAIFAVDEFPGSQASDDGEEPASGKNAYFSILRYKRALKGDNYLGGFMTSREFNGTFNRVAGGDGRFRLNNTTIVEGLALGSFSDGSGPQKNGSYLSLRYYYNTEKWNIDIGLHDVSRDFRTDTGFLNRNGVTMLPVFIMRTFQLSKGLIQRIEPYYYSVHSYDKPGNLFETLNLFVLRFQLPGHTQVELEGLVGNEVFASRRFDISSYRFRANSQFSKRIYADIFFKHGNRIRYDEDNPFQGFGTTIEFTLRVQPTFQYTSQFDLTFTDFYRSGDGQKVYDYSILRSRNEFQFNRYLSLRAILEYNSYYKRLSTDFLAAFTYIPGTVLYLGYGAMYEKTQWRENDYEPANRLLEMKRGFFFKASYLWRL